MYWTHDVERGFGNFDTHKKPKKSKGKRARYEKI